MKSKVYFTRALTPEAVVKMYNALGVELPGKVAVKIHTGEQGKRRAKTTSGPSRTARCSRKTTSPTTSRTTTPC